MRQVVQSAKRFLFGTEPQQALPIGMTEFNVWARRIIDGAAVPGLTEDSALFALSSMLLHLPSTQSFHSDAFFVHALRKSAINETAYAVMKDLEGRLKERKAAEASAVGQQKNQSALKLVSELEPEKK